MIREANSFAVSGHPLSGSGRDDIACRFWRAAFPDGVPHALLAVAAVSECWGVAGLLPAAPRPLLSPLLAFFHRLSLYLAVSSLFPFSFDAMRIRIYRVKYVES